MMMICRQMNVIDWRVKYLPFMSIMKKAESDERFDINVCNEMGPNGLTIHYLKKYLLFKEFDHYDNSVIEHSDVINNNFFTRKKKTQ